MGQAERPSGLLGGIVRELCQFPCRRRVKAAAGWQGAGAVSAQRESWGVGMLGQDPGRILVTLPTSLDFGQKYFTSDMFVHRCGGVSDAGQ